MTALPSALPALTPPAPSASGAPSPAEAEGGFADALQQARQPKPSPAGERPERPGPAERAPEGRGAETKPASPAPAREKAASGDAAESAGTDTPAEAARDEAADPATADPAAGALLPPWLEVALARPVRAAEALPTGRPGIDTPGAAALRRDAAAAQRLANLAAGSGGPAAASAQAAGPATPAADAAGERAGFAAALQQAQGEVPRSPVIGVDPAAGTALAAAAAASGPAAGTTGAAAARAEVAERSLPAPLHSPEFAPALGAQLNLLVREGVTEARLHLNPAEMGPISVQIQIEGQTARVEMAAEQAQTRQVLEQAMPVLAGALRDSGLTLTGGGVFEQRREPQGEPGGRPGGSPGGGTASGAPAEEAARPVPLPQGMVDLYA